MAIPSTSSIADQTRIISIVTRGGLNRVDLLWRTGGQLQLQVFSGNNPAPVSDSGPTLLGASVNGQLLQVTVEWGPNAGGTRFFFAIQAPFTKNAFLGLLDNASLTISGVSAVAVSPDGTLSGCSVGHVYVNNVVDDFGIPSPVLDAYTTEPCYTRFTRLCQEEGLNGILMAQGVTDSNQVTMGAQLPDMLVNLMQQIADTDGGMLYEAPDQAALVYRTRLSLYNQGTAYSTRSSLVLDYAQHQLTGALDPVDDDAYTRNDVTAQRINGSFAQAVDSDPLDPLSTLAPPQGVGDYQTTYSLSIGSDNDLPDHAGWRLHLGTVNEPRYPTIRLNLRHPQFTGNVDLMNQALGLDIGDLVVIKNPPAGRGSPDDIRLIVQGYSETLGIFEHDMVLNCSPESPYRVAMLEDLVLGRADTDGSTLAAPYPLGTETTLLVATTGIQPQSPLWTTAGGDFPFDVIAGGERMTVTNITGASSPQTFTVTRSVNSVVKSQTQGTDVRLYQPMVLSL
jgi:hypothetical protein